MARAAITIILAALLAVPAGIAVAEDGVVTCKVASKRRCKPEGCVSMKASKADLQFKAGYFRRCREGKCANWKATDRTIEKGRNGEFVGVVISRASDRVQNVYNIGREYRDGKFEWTLAWSFTTDASIFARFGRCGGNIASLRTG